MVRKLASNRNESGFTLIELLIVVAIIGILATAGIPAYKNMVAKSRKGEAKSLLGQVGIVEDGFYSEYGAFGDNLYKMGYETHGQNYIYTAGFFALGTCASAIAPTLAGAAAVPLIGDTSWSTRISANLGGYYTKEYQAAYGRVASAINETDTALAAPYPAVTTCTPAAGGVAAVLPAAPYTSYTAIATGSIRSGVNIDTHMGPGAVAVVDEWTFTRDAGAGNNPGTLANPVDGM